MPKFELSVTISHPKVRSAERMKERLTDLLAKAKLNGTVGDAIKKPKPPESRSERFAEATALVEQAKGIAEELRDELQQWRDNLPENLQNGDKASELDEAIEALESFESGCDEATGNEPSFPSMM